MRDDQNDQAVEKLARYYALTGISISNEELASVAQAVRNLLAANPASEVGVLQESGSFDKIYAHAIAHAAQKSDQVTSSIYKDTPKQTDEWSLRARDIQEQFGCFLDIFDKPYGASDAVLPIAVKDVFGFGTHRPTGGVPGRSDDIKVRGSPAIERLIHAGACIVGTTRLSPWCYLPLEYNGAMKPPTNPLGQSLLVGGSSSGSAVAVASGAVPAALGTDTGGSIRIPAALCGLYGFKPSAGRIPMEGTVPLSETQDTIGILAQDPLYLRLVFDAVKSDHVHRRIRDNETLRIGRPNNSFDLCDNEIVYASDLAQDALARIGADVRECAPLPLDILNKYAGIITGYEAARFHLTGLRDHPEDYKGLVRERLLIGLAIDEQSYRHALDRRAAYLDHVLEVVFGENDFLILPTVNRYAPTRTQCKSDDHKAISAMSVEMLSMNRWVNLLGFPAMSIPVALPDKIPAAIQIVGRPYLDEGLIEIASALHRISGPVQRA